MFLFMFFYNFLSINVYINLSILFSVSFYNFLLINLHVSFHVFIYVSIYDFLSMLFHHVFEQTHWGNLYYLLCFPIGFLDERIGKIPIIYCASPSSLFYFSMSALSLGKSLSFTMCFPILFPDGLDFL